MEIIDLALDFKTGVHKVELVLSHGVASFRRASDIFLFKSLIDTWVSLNTKTTEATYKNQLKRM